MQSIAGEQADLQVPWREPMVLTAISIPSGGSGRESVKGIRLNGYYGTGEARKVK